MKHFLVFDFIRGNTARIQSKERSPRAPRNWRCSTASSADRCHDAVAWRSRSRKRESSLGCRSRQRTARCSASNRDAQPARAATRRVNVCTVVTRRVNVCTVATRRVNVCTIVTRRVNVRTKVTRQANVCTEVTRRVNVYTIATRRVNVSTAATRRVGVYTVATHQLNVRTVSALVAAVKMRCFWANIWPRENLARDCPAWQSGFEPTSSR